MHTPVLLSETINALEVKKDGAYIDATAGESGHLIPIAKSGGKVLAIDWDNEQIKNLELKVKNLNNVTLVAGNFADIVGIAKTEGFSGCSGILFDLGLSVSQIKHSGRGFSFKNLDEPLDMRLGKDIEQTATQLITSSSEESLYEIFAGFSEEINSLAISRAVYRANRRKKIQKVKDLIAAINEVVADRPEKTYARIFQALRIAVNNEFENLKSGLVGAKDLLKKDGRLVVISFHSLEDRIVKKFMQSQKDFKILKKTIGRHEHSHSFERSAIVRVAIKL